MLLFLQTTTRMSNPPNQEKSIFTIKETRHEIDIAVENPQFLNHFPNGHGFNQVALLRRAKRRTSEQRLARPKAIARNKQAPAATFFC